MRNKHTKRNSKSIEKSENFLKSWLAKWSAQGLELEYENKSVTIKKKKNPQIAEIHRLSCLYELLLPWILTLTSCTNSLPCRNTFLTVKIYPETSHFFFYQQVMTQASGCIISCLFDPKSASRLSLLSQDAIYIKEIQGSLIKLEQMYSINYNSACKEET